MQRGYLEHRFVKHIPDELESGVLYISIDYGTAAHSCCCGCGEEVVTPFTPTDWRMTFDGETVSLNPSIGNWTLACRSHYVVRRGQVIEAEPWTDNQVEAERQRDRSAKSRFYGAPEPPEPVATTDQAEPPSQLNLGCLGRIMRWVIKAGR